MLKMGAWLLHQIGDKDPPAARDSSEATFELNRRCYPCVADIVGVLSSSLSLSGGLSIQDEDMDVARSVSQEGSHPCVN